MTFTISIWALIGAVMIVIYLLTQNYFYRKQVHQLKDRLQGSVDAISPQEYLQTHLHGVDKLQAIKQLRQHYPELTLIEANNIWQHVKNNNR